MAANTSQGGRTDPVVQNAQLRQALLATAYPMEKYVGSFTGGALGGTTRIKLFNVGILTRLIIKVAASITIGTADATASQMAPFNLINRVRITDYDGTDRVNMSGYMLGMLQNIHNVRNWGRNTWAAGGWTSALAQPNVPTAQATATLSFWLEIPICVNPVKTVANPVVDTRGAILMQTGQGEVYLNIDWNSTLVNNGDVTAVYNGAATSTVVLAGSNGIVTDVYQEFLFPQSVGGQVPLPTLDLLTVRELNSIKSTDNIAAGLAKLINYPNMRSVRRFLNQYVNNSTIVAGDVSKLRLIANGSNVMQDRKDEGQVIYQRGLLGNDLNPGLYFYDHTQKPIETALFGNVQAEVTPANASGTSFVEFAFDSLYTKGMALPGLSQASG